MIAHRTVAILTCVTILATIYSIPTRADERPGDANSERPTVSSLPRIPAVVHEQMQSQNFDGAVQSIDLELKKPDVANDDYLLYLKGRALTELKKYEDADAVFEALCVKHKDGRWVSRARFGQAHIHVLNRDYVKAGAIYQKEAERLLSRNRKDDLVAIYLEFADRYFDGVPADDPSKAKKPDYAQALTYYTEALKPGPSVELRQKVEFRIARCLEETGKHAEAIAAFTAFLSNYTGEKPASGKSVAVSVAVEAMYRRGSVQLAASQRAEARRTWQNLLTDFGDAAEADDARDFLTRAQYRLAHTYGLPSPNSVGDLELSVTLAEQFLVGNPDHKLAPVAELEVAQGLQKHGRHEKAVERLKALIDNEKYANTPQIPIARRMLGQALMAQRKHVEAITAWKAFLDNHPTDSEWPNVQKQIVDAEYSHAIHARDKKNYEQARVLWQTFLNKYPLDARAASILEQFGNMKFAEAVAEHSRRVKSAIADGKTAQSVTVNKASRSLFEAAIADWRRVVQKYPDTNEASSASFMIGVTLEDRLAQLPEALEAYRKVSGQRKDAAEKRIAGLTTPQLEIATERKFRSDEKPSIKLTTRNVEAVTVKVYRIDMADYFRKMHLATGVEDLDIALIDPDEQFEHKTADFQEYERIVDDVEIPVDGAGVTAVTVSSEKLEATTMVVVSDLDVVVKSSRNELFLFAENMLKRKPASGVSVLISDGSEVFAEEITNDDGVLQKSWDQLKSIKDLRVFAIHEGHVASTVNTLNGLDFAVGLSPRGYLYTDRPAYRSGQLVNIKGVVRWVDQDRFTFKPGEKFKLDVYDSRGRTVLSESVSLNRFGTVNKNVMLPETAPQGNYRVCLHRNSTGENDAAGQLSFETRFAVTEYRLESVQLGIDIPDEVFFRGDKVEGTISLKYYYGSALAGEEVRYSFGPDGEQITAKTDEKGEIAVSFDTQRFSESQPLALTVHYPGRNLQATKTVYLATRGFDIKVASTRDVYIAGETFEASFTVASPAGTPVGTELTVEVFEQTLVDGVVGESLVQTHKVASADDGTITQTLQLESGGKYIVRATGTDQFGNNVSGQKLIRVSGDEDSVQLRILADRHSWNVGESAPIKVHWRGESTLGLVTFEGAEILGYQLIELKKGNNTIPVEMVSKLAPNFQMSVAVMERNKFHSAASPFQVAQKLRVSLNADKEELKPGENLNVTIEVTDSQGNPIEAEVSLGLVQQNLLSMFADVEGPIDVFFSQGARTPSLRQTTSCTFQYRPTTTGISEFLLAEMERRNRMERESVALLGIDDGRWMVMDEGGVRTHTVTPLPSANGTAGVFFGNTADAGVVGSFDWSDYDTFNEAGQVAVGGVVQRLQAGAALGQATTRQRFSRGQSLKRLEKLQFGVPVQSQPTGEAEALWFSGSQEGQQGHWSYWGRPGFRVPAELSDKQLGELSDNLFDQNEVTVNGLTAGGRLLALNGRGPQEIRGLMEGGDLQLLGNSTSTETGFWDPAVTTDKNGKATVVITMPARSTAWQLRTKGINGESLAGEATADVVTRKSLFGEMKLPQSFVVGDKAIIPVEIHSSTDKKDVSVDVVLTTTLGDTSTEQRKTISLDGVGIHKLAFPVTVTQAESAAFELQVTSEDSSDTARKTVTVRPFGFPVFATSSGTSSQSTIAFVKFNAAMTPTAPSLDVVIGPNINRSLLDVVLGGNSVIQRCGFVPGSSVERSVTQVMAGTSLLKLIGNTRESDTPDGQALSARVTSAISHLVSAQRDDGAWSWNGDPKKGTPDAYMTARIMWAISMARSSGFAVPAELVTKGTAYLKTVFSKSRSTDLEIQTVLLQSLAANNAADFALANRLYRERNRLRQSGLIHLALALVDMNHKDMAEDVLALVKLSTDLSTVHSNTERDQSIPWLYNSAELRALYFLSLQEINPAHADVPKLAKWLMASRIGSRWAIEKVNGVAVTGLAIWHGRTKHLSEKYRLLVSVNGQDIETLDIDPSRDASRRVKVPFEALARVDQEQEIEFKLEGRGTFSYSAVLTGFVDADRIKTTTRKLSVSRVYEPARRMLDGKEIPRGFGVVNGSYQSFTNPLTQLPVGARGEVTLRPRQAAGSNTLNTRDYLILTESIPSGCTVLDGSITGTFERYELEPGRIKFYLGNARYPSDIRYTLIGYVPGQFRTPQTVLSSFYDPSQMAVAGVKSVQVLPAGEVSADEYRLTPDEQYHFGERYLAKGNIEKAHEHLSALFSKWRLDNDKYKNVVQWLFRTSLAKNSHSDVVRFFEIIKEKFSDVEVSFENILKVAASYKELSEYERSYLVYRATIQGNFERESQVTGFLNKRGEFLRSTQILEDLFTDYPAESYVATATYALAQEVYRRAPNAKDDARLKQQHVNRVHLIDAAIHMLDHFVTTWANDPASDQACFALSTALIDLDQYEAAIDRCNKYAERFKDSRLLDSFWYITGYSHFELENHDEALKMCRKVADAKFPVAETGGERPAQNKWEAVYIMGQVYHSLGNAAKAIAEYTQVKERFADAAEAINFFSRKEITLDEVVTIKPNEKKVLPLQFRNIPEAAVKVYRIDLMKFGLMQRNLDRITAINLAGIKPYHEATVKLGDGNDYRDREHELDLPLKDEGAYLVVCRGDNLYASGLVLVSPLTLSVQEDATSGRVRVTVKDATDDAFIDDVDVKVIGTGNDDFQSGETDLRGLFVADDVKGTSTVIAMADQNRYAFFRGESPLQGVLPQPAAPSPPQEEAAAQEVEALPKAGKALLRDNIMNLNGTFQQEQQSNYGELLNNTRSGIQSFEVDGAKQ